MSTVHLIRIRCDACGRETGFQTEPDTARKALAEAYAQGWRRVLDRISRKKVDVCESCLKLHKGTPRTRFDGNSTSRLTVTGLLDLEIEDDE